MITDFKTCSIRNFEILICTYFLQLFLVLQILKYKDKFTYVLKESMPYVFDLLVFENKFAYSLVYKKRHFGGTLFCCCCILHVFSRHSLFRYDFDH